MSQSGLELMSGVPFDGYRSSLLDASGNIGIKNKGPTAYNFRQPGDFGRYVAFNDPGQPGAGFSNYEEYAKAKQGNNMTVEERNKPIISRIGQQAAGNVQLGKGEYKPTAQQVKEDELFGSKDQYLMPERPYEPAQQAPFF